MNVLVRAIAARRGAWLLLCMVTLVPRTVRGQEAVTLEDAIKRALVRSPQMAQQEQAVGNAQTSRRQAWGAFLPNVSVGSAASLRSQMRFDPTTERVVNGSADSYSASMSASYPVFQGGRRFAELSRSAADLSAARARREDQRFQVILQTKNLFFAALRQMDLLEVARRRVEQAQESLDMVRAQARVGAATVSDSLRARLELVNARQAVLQAETNARAARFSLGRQIGEGRPVEPARPEHLEPSPLGLSDEEIMALAEQQSPMVTAAEASARAAGAGVSSAKTAYLPSFTFSTGYDWANQRASFSNGTTSWSLSLRASYPVFNGFQRESNIERARFTERLARLQEDDARLAAREQADAALQTLRTAERAIEIAGEAQRVAEEDLRVVRERYRVGVATILDLVTSQVALDQARTDVVTARYDYVLARAQLEAILGREL